jgi:hypothetical protein
MDQQRQHALARDPMIDILTRGRKTGPRHRTELWFHTIDGQAYLTGAPGPRDGYANVLAHPECTCHRQPTVTADRPANATRIRDAARRRVPSHVSRCGLTPHRGSSSCQG